MRNTAWRVAAFAALVVLIGSEQIVRAQPAAQKQAVVETSAGTFTLDLLSDSAPNTVALFRKTAESGGYNGTAFHRAVRNGLVQGGDPLSKDPTKKAQFGQGGLNLLKGEAREPKMLSGQELLRGPG